MRKKGYNRDEKGDVIMAFSRGRREPLPEVETKIWTCTNDDCQGWMRESFSFEKEPACPLCESEMKQDTKMLPKLE